MKKTVETERRLVEASYQIMKRVGFDAASIKDICKEAGVAYSTFYYYFPSKESVVPKFYTQARLFEPEDFASILRVEGAWNRLWAAHSIYIEKIYAIGPEICAQLNRSLLSYPERKEAMETEGHRQVLEPLIAQAQLAGELFHGGTSEDIWSCSNYLVWGIYFHWSMNPEGFELHREMRRNLEIFYQLREDLRNTSL